MIQLFRSASSCSYRKDGLVGDKICNSPRRVNQLATVDKFPTVTGQKQYWFCYSEDLPQHFLGVLRCFGVFRTISDIVFKAAN